MALLKIALQSSNGVCAFLFVAWFRLAVVLTSSRFVQAHGKPVINGEIKLASDETVVASNVMQRTHFEGKTE